MPESEPHPDLPLTAEQVCRWRPALNTRTLRTWADGGLIPYGKRSAGKTAANLYRLRDVDDLLAGSFKPATKGVLAGRA